MRLLYMLLFFIPVALGAQKQVYIPFEWQQPNGLDYSFDRSAASGNFIIFWGPLAGTDPTQAPADIAFDPQFILNTAEELYRFYVDTIQFVDDDEGLLNQYKIILVMLHTWTGVEGWAFGGNYDGTVGAMWMHPHAASSGPTLAHEFTHTLQNYTWMLNPGHGFIDSSYVGFFWETHAEFMALQRYPSVALEFDMARWLNTCQFHWSSTRHHYQAFVFLQFIKELDGIEMINRMWNESNIGEHPLQTYKRLKGISQETLNDLFGNYAMRNVTWDYEIGDLLRERISTLETKFVSHATFIPEAVDTSLGLYRIPNHLAPQDYGYNIIRLYPKEEQGCQKRVVHLHLVGHTIYPGYDSAGWRYGLVAVDDNQQPRYSPLYLQDDEITFEMEENETELYLVVIAAPQIHHNYQWEPGFPKIYRYPYDFRIENAWPEGFQPGFREVEPGISGAPHINGGGFVAATASVDATAYVGPKAQVLDQAQVRGNARIEDFAIVQNIAVVEGSAKISDKAIISEDAHIYGNALIDEEAKVNGGCNIYGYATVKGNSLIFYTTVYDEAQLKDNTFCWGATLHVDVLLGGDAEFFSDCSDGTYLQVEGAYNRNCDGLEDHPANVSLITHFQVEEVLNQFKLVCDSLIENTYVYLEEYLTCEGDTFYYNGIPLTTPDRYIYMHKASNGADSIVVLDLYVNASTLYACLLGPICPNDTFWMAGYPITMGQYEVLLDTFACGLHLEVDLKEVSVDTNITLIGNSLVAAEQSTAPILFICEGHPTWLQPSEPMYQWFDCSTNLPVPGAVQATFTPTYNGDFKLRFTTEEECEFYSGCHSISTVSTSILETDFQWLIQPNPVSDNLQVLLEDFTQSTITIELFDMTGHRHFKRNLYAASKLETIDVQSLSSGVYVIKLTNSTGQFSTRTFSKI